jgi:hypothetical protein
MTIYFAVSVRGGRDDRELPPFFDPPSKGDRA